MAYEVLARKWRPQTFEDVVGQDHVTQTLRNAIESKRLAHAYLFVGPRGIGKTSIARIFARALNCEKGPTVEPCGTCDACREIAAGISLDVLEIDGASNNGVEQVRELRETVKFAPAHGQFKIYIIDEVHMLSVPAFNALLKTLEEPPAHVKFIFATTEPQKVLPTILSRCQRFDLSRIPAGLIVKHLKEIAKKEKVSVDDAALAAIARGAEGGLRDAESTLDQLIAFCGNQIAEKDVLSVFGLGAQEKLAALTDAIIDGQANTALTIVKELDEIGKDLQRLLVDLLDHYRNLLVLSLAGGELDVTEADLELLQEQAKRVDSDAVLRIIDALAGAEGRLRYALSKRIYFEIAMIRAIKARQMVSLDAVLQKLNDLKSGVVAAVPAAPANRPANPAAGTVATTASIEEAWAYALEQLGKATPMAKSYFIGSQVVGLKAGALTIGFDPEFSERRDLADTSRNRELLQAKLKEFLRTDVTLKFELTETATPCLPAATKPAAPARKGAEDFKDDPLIKKALEIFKGQIVDVRK